MSKTAICVCGNSGIDYLDYPQDITVFRSLIHFGDLVEYVDFLEIKADEFYQRLKHNPDDIPKTAYTSIGEMLEHFQQLEKAGYQNVIVIIISSQLSGMYQAVVNLAQSYFGKLKIYPYDSKIVAYPEAYLALTAYQLALKDYPVTDILNELDKIRSKSQLYFTVDTLLYLIKNGRLSQISGSLGSWLKLRPLLSINDNGEVATLEKIRTTKKAQKRLLDLYFEQTLNKNVLTLIIHAHNDHDAEIFKNEILKQYPKRQIIITYITPVVGAHAGPKAIGIGFIELD